MIVSRFNLKDIKDYEVINKCSLLERFNEINFHHILEFIKLGNPNCDDEQAGYILDRFLADHNLEDVYCEIRDVLTGKRYIQEENSKQAETKEYRNLTDLYQSMGVDLRAYANLGYSEFWSMSVDDLFLEFNIVNDKVIKEKQDKINDSHLAAQMFAQAVWGKLGANPPQLKNNSTDIDDEESDMDGDALRSMFNMKAFVKKYNGGVENG